MTFENALVAALRSYLEENGIRGRAWRMRQAIYNEQGPDVLLDSPDIGHHLFECKSVSGTYGAATKRDPKRRLERRSVNWSRHFGDGQYAELGAFILDTGRIGWLALELRWRAGSAVYFLPWAAVHLQFGSISVDALTKYPTARKEGGHYAITEDVGRKLFK